MAESEVGRIPRPRQMRGLLHSQIKRSIAGAILFAATCAISWKVFVAEPHKRQYREFYKTYDAEKEFEIMRNKGLFNSCDPDP